MDSMTALYRNLNTFGTNMKGPVKIVYLVSNMAAYLLIGHCHSRFEGHFTNSGKQYVQVDEENLLEKRQVRDLLACAKVCVTLPQCDALFYNKGSHQCVLHKNTIDTGTLGDGGQWRFWRRQNPDTESLNKKTPYMFVFAIHANVCPYWINLDTEEWGQEDLPRDHPLNSQINQAEYDDETGIMYAVRGRKLISVKLRSIRDVKDARRKRYLRGVDVGGIGYDTKEKRLFLMIGRGLASMMPHEDENNYDMLWDKILQSFDALSKVALDTKRQLIYFHHRHMKNIFRCNYQGEGRKTFRTEEARWISLDLEGKRIFRIGKRYDDVHVMDTETGKEKAMNIQKVNEKTRVMVFSVNDVGDQLIITHLKGFTYVYDRDLQFDHMMPQRDDCAGGICEVNYSTVMELLD